MTDFVLPFIVLTLISVIVIQAVERYFYSEQVSRERHELLKHILSKNAQEYTDITRVEKKQDNPLTPPDEVPLEEADEEVFDKYLNTL